MWHTEIIILLYGDKLRSRRNLKGQIREQDASISIFKLSCHCRGNMERKSGVDYVVYLAFWLEIVFFSNVGVDYILAIAEREFGIAFSSFAPNVENSKKPAFQSHKEV